MNEIKTKSTTNQPRTFDKAGAIPKTAMKEMWLHTKDKVLSETMGTPFASQQEASNNTSANTAGDQMLSGAEGRSDLIINTSNKTGKGRVL